MYKKIFMRHVWKDILTMINTAAVAGIVFYGYYADYNASLILSLAIFVFVMLLYLVGRSIRRQRSRKNY